MRVVVLSLLPILVAACAGEPAPVTPSPVPPPTSGSASPLGAIPDEPVPALRLPTDAHPVAEAITLQLDPRQDTFAGSVDIDLRLDAPRRVVWLHGKDLDVTAATLTPDGGAAIAGTWQERSDSGIASVTLAQPAPAGKARLHVAFSAHFGRGQRGLYKAKEAGQEYVFTQFESIEARQAFPCFDEPSFKIPFTTTLVVPSELVAVANTREASRATEGANVRVSFAPTLPLPSYLVAFAVGNFDVVTAPDVPPDAVRQRPLPLRAITAKGRGPEIAYALSHTGEIVSILEQYAGIEYPWDKLDIVAVPGKGGAMENAGLVTFGEQLLLMDPKTASVGQRRAFASVTAHELAHQWTGDLVTMAWWDDTWLNEAFATWLGAKAADQWNATSHAEMGLLVSAQGAMDLDALPSTRSIRQPIASTDDIENAFDAITYRKGGQVLSMFEHWVGADAWQKGFHAYLVAHKFGNATADDFLQAENDASGRDVKTAFHTFLDQPGVPLVEARVECTPPPAGAKPDPAATGQVHLEQSRLVMTGEKTDPNATWQIPVCVRTDRGTACTLLKDREGTVAIPTSSTCPAFVLPNADANGYYRFALGAKDLDAVRRHEDKLSERERVALASSLRGSWERGSTLMADVLRAEEPFARDAEPAVADQPGKYVETARSWLFADPLRAKTEAYGRSLYGLVARKLGWDARKDDGDDAWTLRSAVLGVDALVGRDPAVRAEAKKRGLAYAGIGKDGAVHPEAVEADLADTALLVVGEEADQATWDALHTLLGKTLDEAVRRRLLRALAVPADATLSAAARELTLDPALRDSEVMLPLAMQLGRPETRSAAWSWMKEHYDAILARMPRHHGGVQLVGAGSVFCDDDHAKDVQAFFGPKVEGIEGGPRALALALESVRLCSARREAQEPSARTFFRTK